MRALDHRRLFACKEANVEIPMWWGHKIEGDSHTDFYANGHFGQRLYISPSRDLVLVRLGSDNHGVDWVDFLASMAQSFDRVRDQGTGFLQQPALAPFHEPGRR
jgi:CubicO group peptidase (beta-lactamase class C family)